MSKLGEWWKAATKEERAELARRAGISVGYLRLMAYGYRQNPRVRLALAIQKATLSMGCESECRLPVVYCGDLAAEPVTGEGSNERFQ
jgi:hypothetical protein